MKKPYVSPKMTKYDSRANLPADIRRKLERKAFVTCNADGMFASVSKTFAEWLGWSIADFVGKTVHEFTAEETVDLNAMFSTLLTQPLTEGAWLFKCRDGNTILFHYRAHREQDVLHVEFSFLP